MPSPISNKPSLSSNKIRQSNALPNETGMLDANSASVPTLQQKPGNGTGRVNGQMVSMTALNESGFTSAFSTHNSSSIAGRSRLGINPQRVHHLLSQREQLAAEAQQEMEYIVASQLNNFPYTKKQVHNLSQQYYFAVPEYYRNSICEALEDYQGAHGDNVLMNIAAMGFSDIQSYLKKRDPLFVNESEVDEFMTDFGHHYGAFTGMDDEEDELEELKSRIDDRLMELTRKLDHYLHNAPRLRDGIPLIKGVTGGDNPITTQMNGSEMLASVLRGDALHFNGFLSTSSNYDVALEFCGKMPSTALGDSCYVIDLTKDDEKNEILRRHASSELQKGNVDTGSLLFLFKANNVAGISINATQHAENPGSDEHRLSHEDEVLMAPGHFFMPEKIIINESGVALFGSLNYGR